MYFDTEALTALISDNALALKFAPKIREDWKRVTSPVAVLDAAQRLAGTTKKGAKKDGILIENLKVVEEFLDLYDIELRDMPPATKLLECAADESAKGDLASVLNAACVAYYEAPVFDVNDVSAASEPASSDD